LRSCFIFPCIKTQQIYTEYSKYQYIESFSADPIIDLKRIAAEIAALSSLSSGDVYNVLVNFTEALPKYLKDGYKLRLGDFGIFKVSFSSEGVDDAKQIVPARIRNRRVLYTPGKDIKTSLEGMHFEQESSQ
jgi:predicted histone-like DNA-binding protein